MNPISFISIQQQIFWFSNEKQTNIYSQVLFHFFQKFSIYYREKSVLWEDEMHSSWRHRFPKVGSTDTPAWESMSIYNNPSNESLKNYNLWKWCLPKEDSPLGLSISQPLAPLIQILSGGNPHASVNRTTGTRANSHSRWEHSGL